ncbi:unnamed protein product [Chironomus riparius]|uniref:MADF domain-containing protein n=1 Tax=Chironomus riparius TaxID=315576 RepID=A0A9N9WRJ4_9DIPT|nr:unnamed protein product [Chironomus riparius]
MSKYNWTRQETKDLITLYEINECLWNKNLREYKDRDERISSIQSIADEMKISIEEINKKIHNLRNQYRFELNKMKKNVPGKPRYQTKWPYFKNLSFLENIVSVRGSTTTPNNTNGDYSEGNEYSVEKYDDENENSNDKTNGSTTNNEATTILTTSNNNNNTQPQQIFHVSVEYEEETTKPKIKTEMSGRKRRLITKDAIELATQSNLLNQSTPISTKPTPTIIIDDKSQDVVLKNDAEETKSVRNEESSKKLDNFEIFGLFVANEMKSLSSSALQKKLKRKILSCILEVNNEDGNEST